MPQDLVLRRFPLSILIFLIILYLDPHNTQIYLFPEFQNHIYSGFLGIFTRLWNWSLIFNVFKTKFQMFITQTYFFCTVFCCSWKVCSKTPSGYLKTQTVMNPVYTVFFPIYIHAYLWKSLFYKLGIVRD